MSNWKRFYRSYTKYPDKLKKKFFIAKNSEESIHLWKCCSSSLYRTTFIVPYECCSILTWNRKKNIFFYLNMHWILLTSCSCKIIIPMRSEFKFLPSMQTSWSQVARFELRSNFTISHIEAHACSHLWFVFRSWLHTFLFTLDFIQIDEFNLTYFWRFGFHFNFTFQNKRQTLENSGKTELSKNQFEWSTYLRIRKSYR